jgi:hypothetical protein
MHELIAVLNYTPEVLVYYFGRKRKLRIGHWIFCEQ